MSQPGPGASTVSRSVLRVVWYRFHATFARRVGGFVTLAVLVGLVGGMAMASVAAARSTQSSFPAFVASTNPSDLGVIDLRAATGGGGASIVPTLAGLEHVKRVASWDLPHSHGAAGRNSHGRECQRAGRRRVHRGEPERIVHETGPRDGGGGPDARSDTGRRGGRERGGGPRARAACG